MGDAGLHRTGVFIIVVATLLLAGVVFSRNMGPRAKRDATQSGS
ncbi:hypothetical protein [Gordonia tangerina]|nr:hypothetical protein [Gordonia tangerina]